MYRPSVGKPMEAATGGGLLVRCGRARARTWGRGGCSSTPSAARRRLLVASLGVRDSLPAQSLGEEALAVEVHEEEDSAKVVLPSPDGVPPAKATVRVKFVLQEMCAFGEQFLVVGDDPALGLWDPAEATALDWSEGHVWTAKTDLPANKLIEFKFLLRDASGHVRWQHGGNRTLQTTDTPNTLVVYEHWEHGKDQRLSEEEEELSIAAEDDVTFSDDLAGSAAAVLGDEIWPGEDLESNESAVADTTISLNGVLEASEEIQPQVTLEKDQNILINEHHGKDDTAPQIGYPTEDDNARLNEAGTAMCQEDAQEANRSNSIFENDLVWVRKALRQLLQFLGFQIGTTRT